MKLECSTVNKHSVIINFHILIFVNNCILFVLLVIPKIMYHCIQVIGCVVYIILT